MAPTTHRVTLVAASGRTRIVSVAATSDGRACNAALKHAFKSEPAEGWRVLVNGVRHV